MNNGQPMKLDNVASRLNGRQVVFFDGYCNLCNASVSIIVSNNKGNRLAFAPLQSALAQELLGDAPVKLHEPDTILFLENGQIYQMSDAVLRICGYMDWPFPMFKVLRIFPNGLRDWVYRIVSKNRYRWFGKKSTCRIPTPEERSMFFD